MRVHHRLFAAAALAHYAIAFQCGQDKSAATQCVNRTAAIQPCYGANQTKCSVNQYVAIQGTASFIECVDRCIDTHFPGIDAQCQSFQFYFDDTASNGKGGFVCDAFYPAVESYLANCSEPDAVPAGNFYDLECDLPAMSTSGAVPEHPSTDPVTGTCNSHRVFNGNQHQLIGDYIGEEGSNVTQSRCGTICQHTDGCKSYFYLANTDGYELPLNATKPQEQHGTTCVFFSQPVSKLTKLESGGKKGHFWDRNCPV